MVKNLLLQTAHTLSLTRTGFEVLVAALADKNLRDCLFRRPEAVGVYGLVVKRTNGAFFTWFSLHIGNKITLL